MVHRRRQSGRRKQLTTRLLHTHQWMNDFESQADQAHSISLIQMQRTGSLEQFFAYKISVFYILNPLKLYTSTFELVHN